MRRRLAPLLAAGVSLAAVAWLLLSDRETYELRWKFRAGDVLLYRTVAIMGSGEPKSCHVTLTRYTVKSVSADGTAEVTYVIESTRISEGDPDGPLTWDSASGKPPPKDWGSAFGAAMTGVELKVKVDPRGRVLSTEGTEVAMERVRKELGGGFFGDAMTEASFSGGDGNFLGPLLPAIPVPRGGRWSQSSEAGTPTLGRTSSTQEYELESVEDGVALITLVRSETKQSPGELQKALKLPQEPPDPNAGHGTENNARFSIRDGHMVSQRNRTWLQSSTSKGTIFRFESLTETTRIR